jgi:hypothetical protein
VTLVLDNFFFRTVLLDNFTSCLINQSCVMTDD